MTHYLVEHALRNVWCAPQQDRQCILALARLTPRTGARLSFQLHYEKVPLPQTDSRFHVYQIGQNWSETLGLPSISDTWVRVSETCELEELIIDLYFNTGIQYPRTESWLRRDRDNNLLVAVRNLKQIPGLDDNPLYMRLYSNALFEQGVDLGINSDILVRGGIITTMSQLLNLQNQFEMTKLRSRGVSYAFHNGRYVDHFTPGSVAIGDVVEFVYDPTVYRTAEFKISDLDTFNSDLDSKGKYLVHLPKVLSDRIDFYDDIDLFLIRRDDKGRARGLYYHKNQSDAIRMVTHNDYSVPVMYIEGYQPHGEGWVNMQDTYLRFHIREASVMRPLVFEKNRIHELYKLSDAQIVNAMIGTHATVEEWQAANLEKSGYSTLIGSEYQNVTLPLVAEAYGYNAMSVVAAKTPDRVVVNGNYRYVALPVGLRENATIFEYTEYGLLMGVYYHTGGLTYTPVNKDCRTVEILSGQGGLEIDAVVGRDPVPVDPMYNYRVYRTQSGYLPGVRTWEDVTGTTDYVLENNLITFTDNTEAWQYLVTSDKKFVVYMFDLSYRDHLLKFSLKWKPKNGEVQITEVPPGRISLWMNGRALIEGLDYYVKFPEIVICNKEYLMQNDPWVQRVVVRCTGFCDSELNREPIGDFGFIKHGMLSRNNQFDLRDDKVIRCIVDGRLYHRDQLRFAEQDSGVSVSAVREGRPYQINELFVPVRGVSDYDTLVMRDVAREIDAKVRAYMSTYLPEPVLTDVTFIEDKYAVYSPFMAKMLYDIVNGIKIIDGSFRSDHQIISECGPYSYLLEYDPCMDDNVDSRYVGIHPHDSTQTISVNIQQYAYLSRVISLMLRNKVDLTRFVTVS